MTHLNVPFLTIISDMWRWTGDVYR